MAQADNQIQLAGIKPPGWDLRQVSVRVPYGHVLIQMLPPAGRVGSILLPDTVAGHMEPDAGVVLAAWPETCATLANVGDVGGRDWFSTTKRTTTVVHGPGTGEIVVVRPYDGTRIRGADLGGKTAETDVTSFGTYDEHQDGQPQLGTWWRSVLAIWEDGILRMTGNNIAYKPDPKVSAEGTILLSDDATYASGTATIVAAGPLCQVQPGQRVAYNPNKAVNALKLAHDPAYEGCFVDSDYVIEYLID